MNGTDSCMSRAHAHGSAQQASDPSAVRSRVCQPPCPRPLRQSRDSPSLRQAEAVHRPVVIYEPYFGGTHDEKMFRVVKDRERWFGVVMGEAPAVGEHATEQQAARVPLPLPLAERLTMDLSLTGRTQL